MAAKKAQKRGFFLPLLFLVVMGAVAGGVYYVQKEQAHRAQERERLAQEEVQRQHKEALYQGFEDILNDFIQGLAQKMTAYKKQRRVLREIKQSYNFESLEDAKSNYTLFIEELAPMLRKSAIDIMDVFSKAEADILALLEGEPEDTKVMILDQWQDMKREQSATYIRFFEVEDELLRAYEDVLKFYYVHANLYVVNPDTGEILFSRPEDEEKEKQLLSAISSAKEKLSDITQNDAP